MDQVDAEGQAGQFGLQPGERGFHLRGHQAGGAEKPHHAGLAHRSDHAHGGDAVGHFPGDIGVTKAVLGLESGLSQGFGRQGRCIGAQGQLITAGLGLTAQGRRPALADAEPIGPFNHVNGAADIQQSALESGLQRFRGRIPPNANSRWV